MAESHTAQAATDISIVDPAPTPPEDDPTVLAAEPCADTGSSRHGTRPPASWNGLRPLLLRLHFYAGILIGPFLLVAAVTGLMYTATPQIEAVVYRHELKVTPHGTPEALSAQVAAARKAVPDGTLFSVTPATGRTDSTRVVFEKPGLPDNYTQTAFVNPYTSEVLGQERTFAGWWLPVRSWVDGFHRHLNLGEPGRIYSEIAASWLWVEILGGLALWLTAPRSRQRVRRVLVPQGGAKGRRRTMSWHAAVGVWASVGLLGLSATGMTWSVHAGASIGKIQSALTGPTPAVSTTLPGQTADQGENARTSSGRDVGIDAVVASAHAAGLRGVLNVSPPTKDQATYVVKENTRSWPERHDTVAVDPATGKVTDRANWADYPLLSKMTSWGIDAHMGLLFGLANQIVLALLAIALIGMILWGYRMWWLRRPTRTEGFALGRAPTRGTWRRLPGWFLAPAVLLTAAIGYFVPLFGLPLLAFIVVDLIVGARRRRRSEHKPESESEEKSEHKEVTA
ncbi:PepSY-associated TM helix domain-containing protein [Streptomyces sp. NPDC051684]|uniref:PepSY-associated TM helix domain-containing protein n=1 Tax=Streptomyces sp. NPDC051684 TaxID=3365670 RepID=UPI0037B365F4